MVLRENIYDLFAKIGVFWSQEGLETNRHPNALWPKFIPSKKLVIKQRWPNEDVSPKALWNMLFWLVWWVLRVVDPLN